MHNAKKKKKENLNGPNNSHLFMQNINLFWFWGEI